MNPPMPRTPRASRASTPIAEDESREVQQTNDDATISKLSCAQLGYMDDPFVKLFVRRSIRRPTIINRGYYARLAIIRQLMERFLSAGDGPKQVVSLGAGSDTTFFQLASRGMEPALYFEVDFPETAAHKASLIVAEPALRSLVYPPPHGASSFSRVNSQAGPAPSPTQPPPPPPNGAPTPALSAERPPGDASPASSSGGAGPEGAAAAAAMPAAASGRRMSDAAKQLAAVTSGHVTGAKYRLVPCDIRRTDLLAQSLLEAGLNPSLPTLVVAECVLVYCEPAPAAAALKWAAETFSVGAVIVYDPMRPHDAFGHQMLSNLEARGVPLRSISAAPDPAQHEQRLLAAGWSRAEAVDMDEAYRTLLDPRDRRRIERLEFLDELEEFRLLLQHYVLAIGVNAPPDPPPAAAAAAAAAAQAAAPAAAPRAEAEAAGPRRMDSDSQLSEGSASVSASVSVSASASAPVSLARSASDHRPMSAEGRLGGGGLGGRAASEDGAEPMEGVSAVSAAEHAMAAAALSPKVQRQQLRRRSDAAAEAEAAAAHMQPPPLPAWAAAQRPAGGFPTPPPHPAHFAAPAGGGDSRPPSGGDGAALTEERSAKRRSLDNSSSGAPSPGDAGGALARGWAGSWHPVQLERHPGPPSSSAEVSSSGGFHPPGARDGGQAQPAPPPASIHAGQAAALGPAVTLHEGFAQLTLKRRQGALPPPVSSGGVGAHPGGSQQQAAAARAATAAMMNGSSSAMPPVGGGAVIPPTGGVGR